MNQQLSLFEDHFQAEAQAKVEDSVLRYHLDQIRYWQEHFDWKAKVGMVVRISSTIAFCQDIGRKTYAYCMKVKVLELTEHSAIVETTKEWEEATHGSNKAGCLWKVHPGELAPIF